MDTYMDFDIVRKSYESLLFSAKKGIKSLLFLQKSYELLRFCTKNYTSLCFHSGKLQIITCVHKINYLLLHIFWGRFFMQDHPPPPRTAMPICAPVPWGLWGQGGGGGE